MSLHCSRIQYCNVLAHVDYNIVALVSSRDALEFIHASHSRMWGLEIHIRARDRLLEKSPPVVCATCVYVCVFNLSCPWASSLAVCKRSRRSGSSCCTSASITIAHRAESSRIVSAESSKRVERIDIDISLRHSRALRRGIGFLCAACNEHGLIRALIGCSAMPTWWIGIWNFRLMTRSSRQHPSSRTASAAA